MLEPFALWRLVREAAPVGMVMMVYRRSLAVVSGGLSERVIYVLLSFTLGSDSPRRPVQCKNVRLGVCL